MEIIDCLERLLISGNIDLKNDRESFLKVVLPYFSPLLAVDIKENYHHHLDFVPVSATPKVSQSSLATKIWDNKASYKFKSTLERIIQFLGKLGSEAHYIASSGANSG